MLSSSKTTLTRIINNSLELCSKGFVNSRFLDYKADVKCELKLFIVIMFGN